MAVTRHPLFVRSGRDLRGLPMDASLSQRLRATYAELPSHELSRRFLSFLAMKRNRPLVTTVQDSDRLADRLDHALVGLIAGLEAPAVVRTNMQEFGMELRRHGLGPDDRSCLVGCMMAALVDLAGHRWRLETIAEWAETMTLLFDGAFPSFGGARNDVRSTGTSKPAPNERNRSRVIDP